MIKHSLRRLSSLLMGKHLHKEQMCNETRSKQTNFITWIYSGGRGNAADITSGNIRISEITNFYTSQCNSELNIFVMTNRYNTKLNVSFFKTRDLINSGKINHSVNILVAISNIASKFNFNSYILFHGIYSNWIFWVQVGGHHLNWTRVILFMTCP